MDLTAFPGGDLVQEGLADLARGVESIPALLVSIGAHRLRRIGLPVPETAFSSSSPEHRLYEKLAETDPDSAHSRYNALIRRLVSFENTAECVLRSASRETDHLVSIPGMRESIQEGLATPVEQCAGDLEELRKPGRLKGRIHIGPDFEAPLPEEIAKTFRGDS